MISFCSSSLCSLWLLKIVVLLDFLVLCLERNENFRASLIRFSFITKSLCLRIKMLLFTIPLTRFFVLNISSIKNSIILLT